MLSQETAQKIEKLIIDNRLVSVADMTLAKDEVANSTKSLLEVLVERKLISDEDGTKLIALSSGIPYVELKERQID